jgi:hypothetical protein
LYDMIDKKVNNNKQRSNYLPRKKIRIGEFLCLQSGTAFTKVTLNVL